MYQPRYARVFTCRVRDVKAFVVPDDGRLSRETTFPLILRRVPLLVLVQPLPNSTLALSDREREGEREKGNVGKGKNRGRVIYRSEWDRWISLVGRRIN